MPTIKAEIKDRAYCPCGYTKGYDNYGSHSKGFWFSFVCPNHKKRTVVKHWTDFDFNVLEEEEC